LGEYEKEESKLTCGLCGTNSARKPNSNSKLEKRLFVFQESHMRILEPSLKFPNAFWNLNDSFLICSLCGYLTLHRHIPFVRTQEGEIFINAPSFKIMWYLNEFSEKLFKNKE